MKVEVEIDDKLLDNDPHKAYTELRDALLEKVKMAECAMEETADVVPFDKLQDMVVRWKQYDYNKAQTL